MYHFGNNSNVFKQFISQYIEEFHVDKIVKNVKGKKKNAAEKTMLS